MADIADILNLCMTDPDIALDILESMDIEEEDDLFFRFSKALAYGSKGIFLAAQSKPWVHMPTASQMELREELGLGDKQLDYLEAALQLIREIEDTSPGFLREMGIAAERNIDTIAIALERCRPGRVQQVLGKTKLLYFGPERLKSQPGMDQREIASFWHVFFTSKSIARAALVQEHGVDERGDYIVCWLFQKAFDEFGSDETLGDNWTGTARIYLG